MIVYSGTKGRFHNDVNPNPAGLGRIPRTSGSRAKRYARQAREGVCRPEGVTAMRGVSSSRNLPAMSNGEVFTIEPDVAAGLKWVDYLPVFSLEAACGNFGRGMAVEPQGWAKCPPGVKPDRNMFVARVAGRGIFVFRANVGGTRNNKIVLVQHSSIADPDTGGSYTVKKYTSKKKYAEDGTWEHEEIVLKPLNPDYKDIIITNAEDEEFVVVAEYLSFAK